MGYIEENYPLIRIPNIERDIEDLETREFI
jgi:hypothetical protein